MGAGGSATASRRGHSSRRSETGLKSKRSERSDPGSTPEIETSHDESDDEYSTTLAGNPDASDLITVGYAQASGSRGGGVETKHEQRQHTEGVEREPSNGLLGSAQGRSPTCFSKTNLREGTKITVYSHQVNTLLSSKTYGARQLASAALVLLDRSVSEYPDRSRSPAPRRPNPPVASATQIIPPRRAGPPFEREGDDTNENISSYILLCGL
jgi:hypothetical protein